MNKLDMGFKLAGELYWACNFLKNIEHCSFEDKRLKRIEKTLQGILDIINMDADDDDIINEQKKFVDVIFKKCEELKE